MTIDENLIYIDKISLPSDSLTLGELRRRFPVSTEGLVVENDTVCAMLIAERNFVIAGCARALHGSRFALEEFDNQPAQQTLDSLKDDLVETYVTSGVAEGRRVGRTLADELLRNIEKCVNKRYR